jgi:hypothetical protein
MSVSRRLLSLACSLAAFAASSCLAAPEFLGVLTSGEKIYVALRDEAVTNPVWIPIGGNMGDYVVDSYESKAETLLLKRGDTLVELALKKAVIASASAPEETYMPKAKLSDWLKKAGSTQRVVQLTKEGRFVWGLQLALEGPAQSKTDRPEKELRAVPLSPITSPPPPARK